jgi:hypothetical protein
MCLFLGNLSILFFVVALYGLIGLGPVLFILEKRFTGNVMLLAPIFGIVFVGFLGLFRISVWLVPLRPIIDATGLLVVSLLLCLLAVRWGGKIKKVEWKALCIKVLVPVLFIISFAALYRQEGFTLLSAAHDELNYCSNAQHMICNQHTGSSLDIPVARPDHYLYDFNPRDLCYNQFYRRGAEISLATVAVWTGLSTEEAFPVTVGVLLFSFFLLLGFAGAECLGFSSLRTLLLQTSFAVSFIYVFMLHLQGTLAQLCAVQMLLGSICLAALGLARQSGRWCFLSGILAGGVFFFYQEIAIVGLMIPLLIMMAYYLLTQPDERKKTLYNSLILLVGMLVFGNRMIYSSIFQVSGNSSVLLSGLLKTNSLSEAVHPFEDWLQAIHVLGFASYFDTSDVNGQIVQSFWRHPIAVILLEFIIVVCAGWGLLKALITTPRIREKCLSGIGLASALLVFCITLILSYISQDHLRFSRSVQYCWPFIFIGLNLSTVLEKKRMSIVTTCGFSMSIVLLATLVFFNTWTSVRTFLFVSSHTQQTDPKIPRLNPRSPLWVSLRDELQPSSETPILISSFKTAHQPHRIAIGIAPLPHFPGASILSIWKLGFAAAQEKPTADALQNALIGLRSRLSTRASDEDIITQMVKLNDPLLPRKYLAASKQAIIPPEVSYPPEWEEWRDIFSPKRSHFHNIGDVVYKYDRSVSINSTKLGTLQRDQKGIFRELAGDVEMEVLDCRSNCTVLKVVYDGEPGELDILQSSGEELMVERTLRTSNLQTEITGVIRKSSCSHLQLVPRNGTVKLRQVESKACHAD